MPQGRLLQGKRYDGLLLAGGEADRRPRPARLQACHVDQFKQSLERLARRVFQADRQLLARGRQHAWPAADW